MTNLDLQILEHLAQSRYLSTGFLHCLSLSSPSNLSKRLKKMVSDEWIAKQRALEPLSEKTEYFFFLKKRGVQVLLERSDKFASEEEMEIPKTGFAITHDMTTNWVRYFLQLEFEKYRGVLLEDVSFELRRSKIAGIFRNVGIHPDAVLKVQKRNNKAKTFLLEVDNSTENKEAIRSKFVAYNKYLQQSANQILLILSKHSEERLAFLLRWGYETLEKDRIFACTLAEISAFGFFSNIWTEPLGLWAGDRKNARMKFTEINDRDRVFLEV